MFKKIYEIYFMRHDVRCVWGENENNFFSEKWIWDKECVI